MGAATQRSACERNAAFGGPMGIMGHLIIDCHLFVHRKLEGPAIGNHRPTHRDGSVRGFEDPQASAAASLPQESIGMEGLRLPDQKRNASPNGHRPKGHWIDQRIGKEKEEQHPRPDTLEVDEKVEVIRSEVCTVAAQPSWERLPRRPEPSAGPDKTAARTRIGIGPVHGKRCRRTF